MPEITQLSGHRGAQCSSRWAVASSLVLGVPRQVSSSPFVPFPLPLLCPSPVSLPVPLISFSCGLWASLSHFRPLSHRPSLFPSHLQLRIWGHRESGHSEGPGAGQMPSRPSLSLCPVAAAGRVGKGQGVEAAAAEPGTGAQLWFGKKRGNKELGERGCGGVGAGKGCQGL